MTQAEHISGREQASLPEPSPSYMVSVVIPAYNEAENLPVLVENLIAQLAPYPNYEIIIVDDGSNDDSGDVLNLLSQKHNGIRFLLLSRNFGHQRALRAGIDNARGDCVVCMDADLQHPPDVLSKMVDEWRAGARIVHCIRQDPGTVSFFKRWTSRLFYAGLNRLSDLEIEPGSSDFRLIDREVADVLANLKEVDLFYRGLLPLLGYRTSKIRYIPDERLHGVSKYSVRKMVSLAITGVIGTSQKPLRIAIYFAAVTAFASMLFMAYAIYVHFFVRTAVPGWTSIVVIGLLVGTMQLLVLGVIGEYLGQVLRETRQRPPYLVSRSGGSGEVTRDTSHMAPLQL